jgi:hypothetical protein
MPSEREAFTERISSVAWAEISRIGSGRLEAVLLFLPSWLPHSD